MTDKLKPLLYKLQDNRPAIYSGIGSLSPDDLIYIGYPSTIDEMRKVAAEHEAAGNVHQALHWHRILEAKGNSSSSTKIRALEELIASRRK